MIKNIPEADDFYQSGKELLDFAWGTSSDLLTEFDDADYYGFDKEEISDKYWEAARRKLTTSLAIAQQGAEFILKGKIVSISPYLLISDAPARWPSPYEGKAIDFSEFKTSDAQDLIRIFDTFSEEPLKPSFINKFHSLRERRNKIMHSVGNDVAVHVSEVIESILFIYKALFPTKSWLSVRREFLENAPDSELGSGDYATNRVCWETSIVKAMLEPAKVLELIGIPKKQRSYYCPQCLFDSNKDAGFEFKLAVLSPKGPTSTRLYCPVCHKEHEVTREICDGCSGNVRYAETGICLSCGC